MFSADLFDEILIDPAKKGGDQLRIVSGYATAAMAFRHLELLKHVKRHVKIELIVGMSPTDGISQTNHKGFQELQARNTGVFLCRYLNKLPPVHSKLYIWFRNNKPLRGFIGSANYTQKAFTEKQREVMTDSDPVEGYSYFQEIYAESIQCSDIKTKYLIKLFEPKHNLQIHRGSKTQGQINVESTSLFSKSTYYGLPTVKISLLDKSGNALPQRSGLNWGQRPEMGREPNQAYIKLPASVYNSNFFPDRTIHFTVLTDDGQVLNCTRAQDNGKAIHTPHNNSLIGLYFRRRLGIPNGVPVRLSDLQNYGRTDLSFYKIDDETYFMDFSRSKHG